MISFVPQNIAVTLFAIFSPGDCKAGQRTIGKECEDCPRDTYQNEKWQAQCIDCPTAGVGTRQTGSTSVTDCNRE